MHMYVHVILVRYNNYVSYMYMCYMYVMVYCIYFYLDNFIDKTSVHSQYFIDQGKH